jgi:hypothetical protein
MQDTFKIRARSLLNGDHPLEDVALLYRRRDEYAEKLTAAEIEIKRLQAEITKIGDMAMIIDVEPRAMLALLHKVTAAARKAVNGGRR